MAGPGGLGELIQLAVFPEDFERSRSWSLVTIGESDGINLPRFIEAKDQERINSLCMDDSIFPGRVVRADRLGCKWNLPKLWVGTHEFKAPDLPFRQRSEELSSKGRVETLV